ncbi:MAG: hypothetical protein K0R58_4204, partial [Ramlibacter sp.]|nr:hypothetical protein [Ramlibacter sp.]
LHKATRTKGVSEFMTGASIEPMDVSGDDLTAMTRSEIDMWNQLIRTANIKFN